MFKIMNKINYNHVIYYLLPTFSIFLPLTALLKDNGESLLSIVSLTCFFIIIIISIVPGIILAVSNNFIRSLLITVMIVLTVYALYFSTGKPEFSWIPLGYRGVILVFFVSILPIVWLLRDKLGELLLVIIGVLWLGIILTPYNVEKDVKKLASSNSNSLNTTLPRYIHIVLDQHIGIEGISSNNNVIEAKYPDELVKQYMKNGFDVYGRAYSQYNKSLYSFPIFLNFSNVEQPGLFMKKKNLEQKLPRINYLKY